MQTSAAAETGFVLGLLGVLAVPFSLTMALSGALAAVALVASIVGMARASRPDVAGGLLASVGLVLALATLALIGLRYLGLDTAFGDALVPTLADWLDALNVLLPGPVSEKFASVEDYLDSLAPDVRAAVEELRALLFEVVPGATDTISYNMPAVAGTAARVVHYAGWKKHLSLYPVPSSVPRTTTSSASSRRTWPAREP